MNTALTSRLVHAAPLRRRDCLSAISLLAILGTATFGRAGGAAFAATGSAGTVSVPGLVEASGVVSSLANPGVLWTHNDRGGQPRIFAVDNNGRWLGTYHLPGATHIDYEDIARGPGPVPGVSYLYVADIGDRNNDPARPFLTVYRLPEPAVYLRQAEQPPTATLKGLTSISLRYPDTRHNSEALAVDPWSGDLYLFTKTSAHTIVYSAPRHLLQSGEPVTLSRIGQLSFDLANAADISPDGREIILRQEQFAKLWRRTPGQSVADALAGPSIPIPVVGTPLEKNGEAIGFSADQNGYFTLSDSLFSQPLYYFRRNCPSGVQHQRDLILPGSLWHFRDDGKEPPAGWRADPSPQGKWKSGEAPLGYGDGDERTTLGFGAEPKQKYRITYFKKSFFVDTVPASAHLELMLHFDDGAAVFLNGQELVRANLPARNSPPGYALVPRDDLEDSWTRYLLSPSALVVGTNVLAAEVFQASPGSDDLSFDAKLSLVGPGAVGSISSLRPSEDGGLSVDVTSTFPEVILQISPDLISWHDQGVLRLANGVGRTRIDFPIQQQTGYFRIRIP